MAPPRLRHRTGTDRLRRALAALAVAGVAALGALSAGCGGDAASASEVYTTVAPASLASGAKIPQAGGDAVLTIGGRRSTPLAVDMTTLESLGTVSYDVKDPFTKKVEHYEGVLASEALDRAGADAAATVARAHALDDFSVDVKVADLRRYPVLIVTRMNGARITEKQGGPLKLIFPYQAYDLDHNVYDHQWVWSLDSLTLR